MDQEWCRHRNMFGH